MIGLFFGETNFPKLILNKIKKKKLKYFIIDLSKNNIFKNNTSSYRISIGQFGKILKLIREQKCKKVIFAGKINKPKFSELKLDITGIYYMPRIIKASKKGDAAILKELIKILAKEKINVISSIYFNPELSLHKGTHSILKPNSKDLIDIKNGLKILKNLNSYNHIQAIIVKNNNVYKETTRGTKKLIQSIKKTKNKNGILIKFPKKKQDLRVDLPTIGLKTLRQSKTAGLKGIVVKGKQHVFLDKNKCISFANKNKMFISVK